MRDFMGENILMICNKNIFKNVESICWTNVLSNKAILIKQLKKPSFNAISCKEFFKSVNYLKKPLVWIYQKVPEYIGNLFEVEEVFRQGVFYLPKLYVLWGSIRDSWCS